MLCLQKSRRWNWLFPAIGWYCLCAVLMQVMSVWWLLTALYCSSCQRLHANNPHSPSYSCPGLCYMGTVPEKWWKRFKTPLTLYYPAFFFFFFGCACAVDAYRLRLCPPSSTNKASLWRGKKGFPALDSPLSVGMWEQRRALAWWRDGKVGVSLRGMPGTKRCS